MASRDFSFVSTNPSSMTLPLLRTQGSWFFFFCFTIIFTFFAIVLLLLSPRAPLAHLLLTTSSPIHLTGNHCAFIIRFARVPSRVKERSSLSPRGSSSNGNTLVIGHCTTHTLCLMMDKWSDRPGAGTEDH